jgi:uncharacterized protein
MLKLDLDLVIKSQAQQLVGERAYTARVSIPDIAVLPGFATIISGVRRSGKSTLLRMIYQQDESRYTYLHFDDPRLLEFTTDDFFKLEEMAPESLFMFDEVQRVSGWVSYIRYLTEKNQPVYITGSNAAMLSGEMASLLTGRHLSYELFPFSYPEFLSAGGFESNISSFDAFLSTGGFPEYVRHKDQLILQSLFLDILERDIIARHQIRSSFEFKQLAVYLLNNIARQYSVRKLAEMIKVGSPNTISTFIAYLEDAYLFYSIPKFDYSHKKQLVNPKKIYTVDNGLVLANTSKIQDYKGKLFENAVFIQLRRKSKKIYYFSLQGECDFIVRYPDQEIGCYQACLVLSKENYEREVNGLMEAMDFFNLDEGFIVTHNQSDQIIMGEKRIQVIAGPDFFMQ